MSKYTITIKDNETNEERKIEAIDYIVACNFKKEKGIHYANVECSTSQYTDLTRLHLQVSEVILNGFRANIKVKDMEAQDE